MNPRNSTQALQQYQSFQKTRQKPQDVLKGAETRMGIPSATQRQTGLRAAITNTENLIRSVEPSVSGRTSGSLVTEAQKNRLVGLERAPLDDAYREQSRAYDTGTSELSGLQARAMQEAQLGISEQDKRSESLKGLYDVLYGREQDVQAKAERDRAFNEQRRAAAAAAAQSSALANLLRTNETQRQTAAKTPQKESDAAYLGRINKSYEGDSVGKARLIESLRTGTAESKRRYKLGIKLGLIDDPNKRKVIVPGVVRTLADLSF